MSELSYEQVWKIIEVVARAEGLGVFDIEQPSHSRGVLRVYLCSLDGSVEGVTLEKCARIAHEINELPNLEDVVPGEATIEVSSPGVNRRLTRPEHFEHAVGERVKLTVAREVEGKTKKGVVRGVVQGCRDGVLTIGVEEEKKPLIKGRRKENVTGEVVSFPLSAIAEARVDFQF